ncbi:MAG TPA: ATP-binding protein [Stellaceae bacterium]|nr:ATP-binding protein [Stellaceae bacterium]
MGRPRSTNLWRLTPLIALTTAIALLIGGILIVYSGERSYRAQKADETEVEARILAATVGAALSFDDKKAAQTYVQALDANPEVEVAAVYDASGGLFAAYRRTAAANVPSAAPPPGVVLEGDRRISSTTTVARGTSPPVGRVYVRAVLEPVIYRYERYAIVGLLIVMAALLTAVLGVAHSALARINRELGASNQSLQAEIGEREKAQAALRQAQKMEAIGQLTGGVAHDFNNILQVILGNLGTVESRLRQGSLDPQRLRRLIETAIRAADRAAVLTAQLLAFSRRQPLQPKPLDPNKLLAGMSDLLNRTLGEGIEVETVLGARLWQVLADANQLENAILNLAVNARDAMPNGGKLTIETANILLDEAYAAREEDVKAGQYVLIAVSDTGTGMPPDIIGKAFDPFFTTKDVGRGTGLGLSQVYGFLKQSSGHAKIYSEAGEGTTVKLYFPRLLTDAALREHGTASDTPPARGREVILVVEDEPDVRGFVVEMLRELGYAILAAEDGQAALRVLKTRDDIRLLFTDVGLPGGLNGRQLADEAKRRRPDIKVLFTTGYARNAIVHQGRLDPGVELINKPFTYAALAKRVREVLDEGPGSGRDA